MATLHLLRTSGFKDNNLTLLLNTLSDGDGIVLLDDGCYNAHHPKLLTIKTSQSVEIFMIEQHSKARAVSYDISLAFNAITLDDLVTLTFKYQRVITWQ